MTRFLIIKFHKKKKKMWKNELVKFPFYHSPWNYCIIMEITSSLRSM